jgi:primosomal protein N' (replication factor Y) (superfamily II helicase)
MAGAVCLLGSATPALESWANARSGKYTLLELPERVEGRPLPKVDIVDLRKERADRPPADMAARPGPLVLSAPLRAAVQDRLERD